MSKSKRQTGKEADATLQQEVAKSVEALLPDAEMIYADSLVHIGLGPFISKISVGTQSPTNGLVRSVTTLIMPTNALADLVAHLANALGSMDSNILQENYTKLLARVAPQKS